MKTVKWTAFLNCIFISSILLNGTMLCAQTISPTDAIETVSTGKINWTTGEVFASGIGAPPDHADNAAQARAMAERAAYVVAIRNLLETVKGVRIDSETIVENCMATNDVIRTHIDGIVRGARIVAKRYLSDGSVETVVAMPMKGEFLNTLVPEQFGTSSIHTVPVRPAPQKSVDKKIIPTRPEPIKPVPDNKTDTFKPGPARTPEKKVEPGQPALPDGPPSVSFKGGSATGLVIDGRGLGLRPALLPKIVDPQGQEIYVGRVVTRTNAVEQGVAGYAKDVNAAANNFRVTDNPVIIKAAGATGSTKSDVVIGWNDAKSLRELSGKGDFLQYCRVIIVY